MKRCDEIRRDIHEQLTSSTIAYLTRLREVLSPEEQKVVFRELKSAAQKMDKGQLVIDQDTDGKLFLTFA